jgi:hypothetical protein
MDKAEKSKSKVRVVFMSFCKVESNPTPNSNTDPISPRD